MEMTEERVSELLDQQELSNLNNTEKKKIVGNEQSLGDMWDNIKKSNTFVTGVSEGEEKNVMQKTMLA